MSSPSISAARSEGRLTISLVTPQALLAMKKVPMGMSVDDPSYLKMVLLSLSLMTKLRSTESEGADHSNLTRPMAMSISCVVSSPRSGAILANMMPAELYIVSVPPFHPSPWLVVVTVQGQVGPRLTSLK